MANRKQRRAEESQARRAARKHGERTSSIPGTCIATLGDEPDRAELNAKETEMLRAAKRSVDHKRDALRLAQRSFLVVLNLKAEDRATTVLYAVGRSLPLDEAERSLDDLRSQYAETQFQYPYFGFWMNRNVAADIFADLGMPLKPDWENYLSRRSAPRTILTCLKVGTHLTMIDQDYSKIEPLDAPYMSGDRRSRIDNDPLPAVAVPFYDPQQVYAEKIGTRKIVYLDHNVWIDLRDAKTPETKECVALCRTVVSRGAVIFPLAFTAITEAIEISDRCLRLAHADLLDELSSGVTFRSLPILFGLESRIAYRWLYKSDSTCAVRRAEVFTCIPDHLGNGRLDFPVGWSARKVQEFTDYFASNPTTRSVRFIAEQRDWANDHVAMREKYVREMEQVRTNRAAEPKLQKQATFERALFRERSSLMQSYIIPECTNALLAEVGPAGLQDALAKLRAEKGDGSKRRVKELFRMLPMLDQHARIHALGAVDAGRKPTPQDFDDIEHGTAPPVHADVFVTMDRRLGRLVAEAGRGTSTVLSNIGELTRWLQQATVG